MDRHVGIAPLQPLQVLRQEVAQHCVGRSHGERARDLFVGRAGMQRFLDRRHQPVARFEKPPAGLGQLHSLRRAVEEPRADL